MQIPTEMTELRLRLRPVLPGHAAFIHSLRTDPACKAHLVPSAKTAWLYNITADNFATLRGALHEIGWLRYS